ncbi:MAG: hypothetical protein QMC85_06970 [Methanocellales archaeon]|nr:hypothetical protein [Methanocellales archaeon]
MPRLTIWFDDETYDKLCDLQIKEQKKKKMAVSMSELIRDIVRKFS